MNHTSPRLSFVTIALLTGMAISLCGLGSATAKDTDIYFTNPNSTGGAAVKPAILMMLDTSGSMNTQVSDGGVGTGLNRTETMKDAMIGVIDGLSAAKIGFGRFSNDTGAAIVFPITDLSTTVTNTGQITVPLHASTDDAEETNSGNAVTISGTDLALPRRGSTGSAEKTVGLRFQNVGLPQGVTITSAKIMFRASSVGTSGAVTLNIAAENADDALPYTGINNDISGRTYTATPTTWSPANWSSDAFYYTSDLTAQVQAVVNRAGWCYDNAMAFRLKRDASDAGTNSRTAYAYDTFAGAGYEATVATLVITYNPATVPTTSSCHRVTQRITQSSDDAEEKVSTGAVDLVGNVITAATNKTLELAVSSTTNQKIGLRFQGLDIPQGATITEAKIEFTVNTANASATALTIIGEKTINAATFAATTSNISGRSPTTASVSWSPANPAAKQKLTTPDLKTVVQEIVDQGTWVSGNAMAFILSGSGTRVVESFDSRPSVAPLLRITYTSSTAWTKTARDAMRELVVGIRSQGSTPTMDSLYEAALYFRGNAVDYGKVRGTGSNDEKQLSRVSTKSTYNGATDTYSGGTWSIPGSCTMTGTGANPDDLSCISESISGSPTYISPFQAGCAAYHLVLLTDGDANNNASATKIKTLTGVSTCAQTGGWACHTELANFLFKTDQSSTLNDSQTIHTHAVGFIGVSTTGTTRMGEMTAAGGGLYRTANTAGELVDAFDDILNDVLSDPTSFVSPSLSVNAFNRLYNLDDVYFSLFEPSLKVSWAGNIKKYKLCTQTGASPSCVFGTIMDASSPAQGAIDTSLDPVTLKPINKIKSSALSYWSSSVDGPNVKVGGAGAKIPAHGVRKAYTYTGSADTGPVDISNSSNVVNTTNVTKTMLGDAAMTASRQTDIVNWLLGQDVKDENNNGVTTDDRWAFADALHSRPLTVPYGKDGSGNPVTKIFVGTNDGGLRMINASSGTEQWIAYIPELLANAGQMMDATTGTHIEGLDGSPTAWIVDNDNNGKIEPSNSDKVYLFVGERRGGRNIYAFDVTPTSTLTNPAATTDITPKFLWRIKGGVSTGFSALGQSWSQPKLTKIWVKCPTGDTTCSGSKVKNVLIFAGGYDTTTLDSTNMPTGIDTMGNAIYIVDPANGSLIWRAGAGGSGANLIPLDSQNNAAMKYAIPSDVALVDSDGDGVTDRLYVGDSRGQLFRIDLGNQIDATSTGAGGSSGFVFADIGCRFGSRVDNCSATAVHNRRMFFYPPAVASVKDATFSSTATYDLVTIQTGNREDPIDIITGTSDPVRNRIYAFRDYNPMLGAPGATQATIIDNDLYDATPDVFAAGVDTTTGTYTSALTSLKTAKGWFVRLVTDPNGASYTYVGEKGLSETTIYQGTLYATTYTPADASTLTGCHAMAEGTAKIYAMNVLTGGTNTDLNHTGGNERSIEIGGGIPSGVVVAILPEGVTSVVGTSGGASQTGPSGTLPRYPTYWHD